LSSQSHRIKISVGVPTRNRAPLLNRALASLHAQEVPPDEVLIGDNGSQDDTQEIVRTWSKKVPISKYLVHSKNIGPLANMLSLANAASGDYFLWLADDDILESHHIATVIKFVKENPEASMVGWTHSTRNYTTGEQTQSSIFPTISLKHSYFRNCSNYLGNPISSYFYSLFRREYLLHCSLVRWSSSGKLFDWMDCAFVIQSLLEVKAAFLPDHLAVYGIDSPERPRKTSDGCVVPPSHQFNGSHWLAESTVSILRSPRISLPQKALLLLKFWRTWHIVTSHSRRNE